MKPLKERGKIFSGRFSKWVPLLIVAVVDFIVLFSVLYFVPSTSPFYTPLYYIFDALTFFAIIIAWQSVRAKSVMRRRTSYSSSPAFIRSTIVDDSDTDEYKQRLKEASDLLLQGRINTEVEFYTIIGERTPKEERIYKALSEMKTELGR